MRNVFIALVCLVLLTPTAYAAASNRANSLVDARATAGSSDAVLASQVATQIRNYAFYTIFDQIDGSVTDGVVTLTGKVTMPYKASDVAARVARVPGVLKVENKIGTFPVSMFDDELRASIARQIYSDEMFWNYGLQVNPSIHVIVENGHVTLTGAVNSEVARRMAEVIARMTPYVFSVDNKLRLDADSGSES